MMKSQEIQDFVEEQMIKQYGVHGHKEFWFGGHKERGVWYWEDGTIISPDLKWANGNGQRAILSSWRSKLLNETLWFSRAVKKHVTGYICEKAGRRNLVFNFLLKHYSCTMCCCRCY